mmetsp:Transcript_73823/g.175739  ORF Transcript_73823/g.175739 Transcript_73823/m.175739 type:complete len:254 (-) Transcript_73823:236-997(-)
MKAAFDHILERRLLAVLRSEKVRDVSLAEAALCAAYNGGVRTFALSCAEGASLKVLQTLRIHHTSSCEAAAASDAQGSTLPPLLVGCAGVTSISQAREALDAGADFLGTPTPHPRMIKWCVKQNVLCIPTCTHDEIVTAMGAGASLVNLIPPKAVVEEEAAQAHRRRARRSRSLSQEEPIPRSSWIKAVKTSFPMLRPIITAGVTVENAAEVLHDGADVVALSASLFASDVVENEDWAQIQFDAQRVVASISR